MTEHKTAWLSLVPGLVASATVAFMHVWSVPNFAFYALSQMLVIAVVALCRPRPAIVSGIAIALAIYFTLFALWAFTRTPLDSMVWLAYVTVLPGALVGILCLCMGMGKRPPHRAAAVVLLAAGAALAGLGAGQIAVCSALMHCTS